MNKDSLCCEQKPSLLSTKAVFVTAKIRYRFLRTKNVKIIRYPSVFFLQLFSVLPSHGNILVRKDDVQGVRRREGDSFGVTSPSHFSNMTVTTQKLLQEQTDVNASPENVREM